MTRLGFGAASIGGLFTAVADADALATVARAWDLGIRTFDVAPLYGYGAAERRLGMALADQPRDEYVLSTKVGRLVRPTRCDPARRRRRRQALDGRDDAFYARAEPVRLVFDYSADGVRRSIEESLERLGLERIDIALIHDPDDHWEQAIGEAWPALARMREEGMIRAVGAGMNQSAMLARFAREGDFDVVPRRRPLHAPGPGRPDRAAAAVRGARDRRPRRRGDEQRRPRGSPAGQPVRLPARATAPSSIAPAGSRAVCERHGVPLRAAAIQFPLAHPAVVSLDRRRPQCRPPR